MKVYVLVGFDKDGKFLGQGDSAVYEEEVANNSAKTETVNLNEHFPGATIKVLRFELKEKEGE